MVIQVISTEGMARWMALIHVCEKPTVKMIKRFYGQFLSRVKFSAKTSLRPMMTAFLSVAMIWY